MKGFGAFMTTNEHIFEMVVWTMSRVYEFQNEVIDNDETLFTGTLELIRTGFQSTNPDILN